MAAVPLEHQERLYGELVVYAERPYAFNDREQVLLADLGRDIGNAIHSLALQEDLRTQQNRQRALFENAPNPVIAGEEAGSSHQIVNVNHAFEETFGYTAEEIIGTDVAEILVPDDGMVAHDQFRERVEGGESITTEVERITADGPREFLLHVIPYGVAGDTIEGTYAWYMDITDRKQREREIDRRNSILRTILENLPMGVLVEDADSDILMANDQLCDIFDVPLTGDELIGRDCDSAAEQIKDRFADPEAFIAGVGERHANREMVHNEELRLDDGRTVERDYLPYSLPEGDANMWVYRDITTRKKYEQTLKELIASTQDLQSATTPAEVATIGAETAKGVFDRPINGVHLYDESDDELKPVSWTGAVEEQLGAEPPALPVEDSLAGQVYRTKDRESYGNIAEQPEQFASETPFQSELICPLGDHGVFILSATEPDAFDQVDETLAQLLSTSLTTALNRVEQRQQLETKNERLDEFASVLSHDLRNPLNVAEGRLELAQGEFDSEHFAPIERSHTRMRSLIESLLALARKGNDIGEFEPVDLDSFAEKCWRNVDTEQATLETTTDQTIQADRNQLKQLLENLVRNAVEHGDTEVTITIGDLDDGFFVEDDGPGIPPDDRDSVFDLGYSTADDGTGFGLAIVRRIAQAHRWESTVTDGADGGARFEITGVTTGAE
ncbi:MAG: PAS sensor histidine kinase [Halonotius sp. J07HN6]|nr:MAG: PAS sensor histidine kinase [Halonotius sp. J07HN6]